MISTERKYQQYLKYRKRARLYNLEQNVFKTTGKPCSCSMCGNPRKYFNELTIQEKRADEQFKVELDEIFKEQII